MLKWLQPILEKQVLRPFHTYQLGFLIYSVILNEGAKSYLEIGCGYGATMVFAGLGLKDVRGGNRLVGVDIKKHRMAYAEKLMEKFNLQAELILKDATKYEPDMMYDVIFLDPGHTRNQAMIDRFAKYANKAIIVHDVDRKLVFPEDFTAVYLPNFSALACRYVEPKPNRVKVK